MAFHLNGYSNFHDDNQDWIVSKIKNIEDAEANTAESAAAASASANAAAQSAENAAASATSAGIDAETIAEKAAQIDTNTARLDNLIIEGTPTEGNAELIDIRVAYDNVTYPTAGESVRAQVSENHDDIVNAEKGIDNLAKTKLFRVFSINTSTGEIISDSGNTQLNTDPFYIGNGMSFYVNVDTGYYLYVTYYSSNDRSTYISTAARVAHANGWQNMKAAGDYMAFTLVNTAYATIPLTDAIKAHAFKYNMMLNRAGFIFAGDYNAAPIEVDTAAKTITFSASGGYASLVFGNRRINLAGKICDYSSIADNYGMIFYDYASDSFFFGDANTNDRPNYPDTLIYIGCNWRSGQYLDLNVLPYYLVNGVKCTPYDRKFSVLPPKSSYKMAVLGDSISTYTGYSESEYLAPFYPHGNVDDVNKTWWDLVRRGLRFESCSVSAVSQSSFRYQDNPDIPYGGDDGRITRLGANGTPSHIFIELGTNDGYYNNYGNIPYTTNISDFENIKGTIYGGIGATLNKVQKAYPGAKIYVLLPKYVSIGAVNNPTYTWENFCKICDAIMEMCRQWGVKVIDLRKCGINYRNIYSYTLDGIHPNAAGMESMANYVIEQVEL